MKAKLMALAMLGAAVAALPAMAHHSAAMYDNTKKVTLEGTVRDWQWTNPHIFLELMVLQGGVPQEYSLEGASPSLVRKHNGWTREMLKAGDKVTVVMAPLRDGRHGGSVQSISINGAPLGDRNLIETP
ncbi:MAG TPA: DUF6152 family protein [Caulobacteraceae bacterium]|nr:DUF6152 family protein [Caulobacteraceae bacterium]